MIKVDTDTATIVNTLVNRTLVLVISPFLHISSNFHDNPIK